MITDAMELQGLKVLVTRAEHQQANFNSLLNAVGAENINLPCIGIRSLNNASVMQQISASKRSDIVIFTSVNAVYAAHQLSPLPWPQMCSQIGSDGKTKVLAIGLATAKTLKQLGITVNDEPVAPYNSESLLSLSVLKNVNLQKVSIVKGKGGRDLLAKTLQKRAMSAETIDVYERFKPEISQKRLDAIFLKYPPDIVTITSNEVLQNLFDLVKQPLRERLLRLPLIVNSERGAQLAKDLCFQSHVLVATAAGDIGQLEAIKLWNSTYRFKL